MQEVKRVGKLIDSYTTLLQQLYLSQNIWFHYAQKADSCIWKVLRQEALFECPITAEKGRDI